MSCLGRTTTLFIITHPCLTCPCACCRCVDWMCLCADYSLCPHLLWGAVREDLLQSAGGDWHATLLEGLQDPEAFLPTQPAQPQRSARNWGERPSKHPSRARPQEPRPKTDGRHKYCCNKEQWGALTLMKRSHKADAIFSLLELKAVWDENE